jgi:hypothetical protein
VQEARREAVLTATLAARYTLLSRQAEFIRLAFCFPEIPDFFQEFAGTVQTHVNSQSAGTQAA